MNHPTFVIRVEIPVLQEIFDYVVANQQAEINAIAAQVNQLTERLNQSQTALKGAQEHQ